MLLNTAITVISTRKFRYGIHSARHTHTSSSKMKAKDLKIWKNGMTLTASVSTVCTTRILRNLQTTFHSAQEQAMIRTAVTLCSPRSNTGTAALSTTENATVLPCSKNFSRSITESL